MELICKITDADIGEKIVNMENPQLRLGARGIVVREDAFKREVLEETGCEIEILNTLGTTEEYKSLNNFKQICYVFVGKVLNDTKQLNVTEKEKDEGAKLLWETPKKALELIIQSYDKLVASKYESVYSTKFIVVRDRKILEKYLELITK